MNCLEGIVAINRTRNENAAAERTELPNGKFLYRSNGAAVVASTPFLPLPYERDLDVQPLNCQDWLVNNRIVKDDAVVVERLREHGVEDPEALVAELLG